MIMWRGLHVGTYVSQFKALDFEAQNSKMPGSILGWPLGYIHIFPRILESLLGFLDGIQKF